jgi:hypothetical protein
MSAALALAVMTGACGGTPDNFLSVGGGPGTPGTGTDAIAPTVVSVSPVNGSANVPTSTAVTVTFSESVDSTSITGTSFNINPTTPGTITASGANATFTPTLGFPSGRTVVVTVSGVRDRAGNVMTTPTIWSFTTVP